MVTILRDPGLPPALLKRIAEDDDILRDYRVKTAMALHPKTPKIVALELIRHLFWRDLLFVIESLRVHPQVRRTAEYLLSEQIPDLTLGEKLSLARLAGRSVIRMMRADQDHRVIKVLLGNTRVTEEDVVFLSSRSGSRQEVLRVVGRTPRWVARPSVRFALVKNPGTPPAVGLGLISGLKVPDLQVLVNSPSVPFVIRRTAERMLSEGRNR